MNFCVKCDKMDFASKSVNHDETNLSQFQIWQLTIANKENQRDLTIKSETGQHSQFLQILNTPEMK